VSRGANAAVDQTCKQGPHSKCRFWTPKIRVGGADAGRPCSAKVGLRPRGAARKSSCSGRQARRGLATSCHRVIRAMRGPDMWGTPSRKKPEDCARGSRSMRGGERAEASGPVTSAPGSPPVRRKGRPQTTADTTQQARNHFGDCFVARGLRNRRRCPRPTPDRLRQGRNSSAVKGSAS